MKIQGTLTFDDYVASNFLHLRHSFKGLLVLGIALSFFAENLHSAISRQTSGKDLVITFLPFLFFVALMLFMVGFVLPRRIRRVFEQSKALHDPFDIEIGPDSVVFQSPKSSFTVPWTDLHKYRISGKLIVLYQTELHMHVFPRRWFTEEQFAEFKALLPTKMPGRGK